ncbi:MAG: TIGR01906 family membrane protein [Chloroflexi bacterium]|nr:TIGR01906 family membrane protein [Chloroflexota bacterium]MCC6891254.1 TIGR01906 family membrane protein [Anaerolineae bacterium]
MTPPKSPLQSSPLLTVLRLFLTIGFPFLLVMIFVRLIMSPLFLQFEYNRPGFPEDFYGLTTQERLEYAPFAVQYLLNGDDITYLGDLRFPDGSEMYNARELHHMRDVKIVTHYAFAAAVIVGILVTISTVVLWRYSRRTLYAALLTASRLTIGIIAAIVIISVVSWDTFFTTFHTLFFAGGTWQFAYSDTLIRLFPEQFWFDAALIIGGGTLLISLVTLFILSRGVLTRPNQDGTLV